MHTVLAVDDHPLILDAIENRLCLGEDFQLIGKASSGEEAIQMVETLKPDLVIMDLRMPGMGGIEATRAIKAAYPSIAVVVLTVSESSEHLIEAVLAGAAGYVTKDSQLGKLLDALRAVLSGSTALPSSLLRESLGQLGRAPAPQEKTVLKEPLTEREEEVLGLVAQGLNNKRIGELLTIEETTVKKHVHNIIRKLGVSDRTQAVVLSFRQGLVHSAKGHHH